MGMKKIILCMTCLGFLGCSETPESAQPNVAHPFAGCWQSEDGLAREVWSADPSGWLFGYALNRNAAGEVTFFEQMRFDGNELHVSGPNDDTISFSLVESGSSYVFENSEHDFPQRITYVPSPGRLDAHISLMDGSEKINFLKQAC